MVLPEVVVVVLLVLLAPQVMVLQVTLINGDIIHQLVPQHHIKSNQMLGLVTWEVQ